jgi:hypothetical protein
LRAQALVSNERDLLRAGMSFEVEMRFEGEVYPSVDPLAIQWDSDGPYVWRVVDGKAGRVAIAIVQRNADRVLVKADIAEGDAIVVEGVQSVRDGGDVRVAGAPDRRTALPGSPPEAASAPPAARKPQPTAEDGGPRREADT